MLKKNSNINGVTKETGCEKRMKMDQKWHQQKLCIKGTLRNIPQSAKNEMLKSDPNLQRIKTIFQGTEEKKKYSFHIIGYMTRRQVLLRLL